MEFYVALEDYRDDHNNICLRKEETVVVLDRLSHPGMYKVVRLLADGSKDNEIWVPSSVLQRKKSTAEIIMPAGNTFMLKKRTYKHGEKIISPEANIESYSCDAILTFMFSG